MASILCWDLDETLGHFRSVGDELVRRVMGDHTPAGTAALTHQAPGAIPGISLRAGIDQLLEEIARRGITQVVTTGAIAEYAQLALGSTGIDRHFAAVFSREDIWDRSGKRYGRVLDSFKTEPDQMLIIGDDFSRDRSAEDGRHPVMICEPDGADRPASLLLPVITNLIEAPSIWAGFHQLVESSLPRGLERVVRIGPVEASVAFWGDYQTGERIPVVTNIIAVPPAR